jgi:alkylation response protein AidB-like acyl-CoA dehydrogenase
VFLTCEINFFCSTFFKCFFSTDAAHAHLGSPTCEINFEAAEGYLIGQPNKGMRQMFTFINTSRLGTAMMASLNREP